MDSWCKVQTTCCVQRLEREEREKKEKAHASELAVAARLKEQMQERDLARTTCRREDEVSGAYGM